MASYLHLIEEQEFLAFTNDETLAQFVRGLQSSVQWEQVFEDRYTVIGPPLKDTHYATYRGFVGCVRLVRKGLPSRGTRLVELNGYTIDLTEALYAMDEEIMESVNEDLASCSNQEFMNEYAERHAMKYEEPFSLDWKTTTQHGPRGAGPCLPPTKSPRSNHRRQPCNSSK